MTALLGDPHLRYPLAALNIDAVRHNLAEMDHYLRSRSVQIAPHAKTTMLQEVLTLQTQLAMTWGLTVANAAQGRLAEKAGAQRILVANQLIECDDIAWAARAARAGRTVISLVDTPEGVRWLDTALAKAGDRTASPRHPVLLEVGYRGGRGGTRTQQDVDSVADVVTGSRHLALHGVSGYEGLLGGSGDPADVERVDAYLRRVVQAAIRLVDRGTVAGPELILSAGGSAFFDRVIGVCQDPLTAIGGLLLLRSGCYAVHDHGIYARTIPKSRSAGGPDLRPAATVWARVQSRPDAGCAIAAVGRRHLPHDAGLPTPLQIRYRGGVPGPLTAAASTVALSDQHLHMDVPADSDLAVGDVLPLGISHPCGLFDRWRLVTIIDDQGRLIGAGRPGF
ncbi:alanine racemase [Nonomuraea sp. NPDC049141]|uniref:alanine racemase n=1 Tax=Nonomuraea sp. NPDC049141 TaxID=3155500 RepID=UPI0033E58280